MQFCSKFQFNSPICFHTPCHFWSKKDQRSDVHVAVTETLCYLKHSGLVVWNVWIEVWMWNCPCPGCIPGLHPACVVIGSPSNTSSLNWAFSPFLHIFHQCFSSSSVKHVGLERVRNVNVNADECTLEWVDRPERLSLWACAWNKQVKGMRLETHPQVWWH